MKIVITNQNKSLVYTMNSTDSETPDKSLYTTSQIITYMGNKRKLLPIIENVVIDIQKELGNKPLKIGEGFSGSGVVSRILKTNAAELYTNDLAGYSTTLNRCYLDNPTENTQKMIKKHIDKANQLAEKNESKEIGDGWISKHWSPSGPTIKDDERVYFTDTNGKRIDSMRNYIETIPKKYQPYVLAPLLVECSIHNNTNGQFSSYYKGMYGGKTQTDTKRITQKIHIPYPIFYDSPCNHHVSQMDTNEWAKKMGNKTELDIVYYDPPYNKHPYNIYYFLLDIINDWDKSQEIPNTYRGQPDTRVKSLYNSITHAKKTMLDLINNTRAKYILLSYNDGGIIPITELDTLLENTDREITKIPIEHKTYNRLKGLSNYKRTSEYKNVKEFLYVIKRK